MLPHSTLQFISSDPLGNDANDLEAERYTNMCLNKIADYFENGVVDEPGLMRSPSNRSIRGRLNGSYGSLSVISGSNRSVLSAPLSTSTAADEVSGSDNAV